MDSEHSIRRELRSFIQYSVGVLTGLVALALALYLGYLLNSEPTLSLESLVQILVLSVITLTLAWSVYVQKQKEKFEESQIYLDKAVELIEKSYYVLSHGGKAVSSERVDWVTAARLLTRAELIAAKINLNAQKILYESEHDYQRHRFSDLLKINGAPLPLEFFFGRGSTLGKVGKSAYSTISVQGNNWIPIRVASVIYRFSSFPVNYEDPLQGQEDLSKNERDRLWLFGQEGFYNYIVFTRYFSSTGSRIFQVRDVTQARQVSEAEIDQVIPSISGLEID